MFLFWIWWDVQTTGAVTHAVFKQLQQRDVAARADRRTIARATA
jgi:hypothetical protein